MADSRGILRNADGTLAAGNKAGGRPSLPEAFRAAVDGVKRGDGVGYLYAILDGSEPVAPELRVKVTQWAFERVYGKAKESVDVSVTGDQEVTRVLRVVVEARRGDDDDVIIGSSS